MFELPKLNYDYNSLEKSFDSLTMEIHYLKHHGSYVNNLNAALQNYPDLLESDLDYLLSNLLLLPDEIRETVRNNAGGHWNHSFFWSILTPDNKVFSQRLHRFFNENFGGIDNFKGIFKETSLKRFGSGWSWLIQKDNGEFAVISTPNQDNPLMDIATIKGRPILGLDLWEHAYYLRYQYRRGDYIDAFWNVLDWDKIEELLFV